jgi:hypothetical protein
MKKILLLSLLFIPLFCNSQEIVVSTIFNPNNDKIVTLYYQDYHLERATDSLKVIPLVTFKNYQQECYKDSIKLGPYGSLHFINYSDIYEKYKDYFEGLDCYSISNYQYPDKFRKLYNSLKGKIIYLHRTPTFDRFLKYLGE